MKFESLEELYSKLKPALNTRVKELNNNGIKYIKEEDIWNYLKDNRWNKSENLTLSDCVDDILNTNDLEFKKSIKDKMNNILNRGINGNN